jgi:hypothetical protein
VADGQVRDGPQLDEGASGLRHNAANSESSELVIAAIAVTVAIQVIDIGLTTRTVP